MGTHDTDSYKIIPSSKRYTFLVVDDEPDVVEIIADTLKKKYRKAHIFTATDGQQAMTKYRNSPPSMLITDLSMPKVSGNELITNILSTNTSSEMPVIVISGLSREDRYISEILNGRFRFLPKPFRAHELLRLVDHMFENPINPNMKFKVDVEFLNAFLAAAITAFEKTHSIAMEKVQPTVRSAEYISGDYSFTYSFGTKDFRGLYSICFAKDSALQYQAQAGETTDAVDESLLEVIARDIAAETEESLLKIGHTVKLESPLKQFEDGHRVETNLDANTIVLPLKSTDKGWQFALELTLGPP